jgi:hypothetical protein
MEMMISMLTLNQELIQELIRNKDIDKHSISMLNVFYSFLNEENKVEINSPHVTVQEICELSGYGKNNVPLILKEMVTKNLIRISESHKKGKTIYVNPKICYKNTVPTDTLKMFENAPEMILKVGNEFSEKVLENILILDLSVIEEGLTLIDNQFSVADGFIDILARDKNETLTIIELKVKDDDYRLVQQCVYYPTQFNEPTRMISIAPGYKPKLRTSLESLGFVELKQYQIIENKLSFK